LFQFLTPDYWEVWYRDDWEARNAWKVGDVGKLLQLWVYNPEGGGNREWRLTLPAGVFPARVVRAECGCASDFLPYLEWFAPGVGLVSVGRRVPPEGKFSSESYGWAWDLKEAVVNGIHYPKGSETQTESTTWGDVKQRMNQ
jgi:hypothetical protein